MLHTPGHAPGACCLHAPALGVRVLAATRCSTAGPAPPGGRSRTSRPSSSPSAPGCSTCPPDTVVLTGHGDPTTDRRRGPAPRRSGSPAATDRPTTGNGLRPRFRARGSPASKLHVVRSSAVHAPRPPRAPERNRGMGALAGACPVTLRLFDSLTRELRDFVPVVPGKAGIYICGLTTQAPPHIGHVRFAVAFDMLRRWLTRGHGLRRHLHPQRHRHRRQDPRQVGREREPWWALAYRIELETRRRATTRSACCRRPTSRAPPATCPRCVELIGGPHRARPRVRGAATAAATSTSTCAAGRPTASSPARSVDDMEPTPRTPTRAASATRATSRCGRARKAERARDRDVALAVGRGPPGLAHRVLGDGAQVPRRHVRHPRRRPRPALPAPRERAGPVDAAGDGFASYWVHNAWSPWAARRCRSRSATRCSSARCSRRPPARACATTSPPRTTARPSSTTRGRSTRRPSRGRAHRGLPRSRPPGVVTRSCRPATSAAARALSRRRWTTTSASPGARRAARDRARRQHRARRRGPRRRRGDRPARSSR